jgi:hypothetical protein
MHLKKMVAILVMPKVKAAKVVMPLAILHKVEISQTKVLEKVVITNLKETKVLKYLLQ